MVQLLKLSNEKVISPHTLLACDYLSMLGLKLNHGATEVGSVTHWPPGDFNEILGK